MLTTKRCSETTAWYVFDDEMSARYMKYIHVLRFCMRCRAQSLTRCSQVTRMHLRCHVDLFSCTAIFPETDFMLSFCELDADKLLSVTLHCCAGVSERELFAMTCRSFAHVEENIIGYTWCDIENALTLLFLRGWDIVLCLWFDWCQHSQGSCSR